MAPRISSTQQAVMNDFIARHPEMAKGFSKTPAGRARSEALWRELAADLNAHGDRMQKDWKGWAKYYHDLKSGTKRKNCAIKRHQSGTGGNPPTKLKLSETEDGVLEEVSQPDYRQGLSRLMVNLFPQDSIDNRPFPTTIPNVCSSQEAQKIEIELKSLPMTINDCCDIVKGTSGTAEPVPLEPPPPQSKAPGGCRVRKRKPKISEVALTAIIGIKKKLMQIEKNRMAAEMRSANALKCIQLELSKQTGIKEKKLEVQQRLVAAIERQADAAERQAAVDEERLRIQKSQGQEAKRDY